MDYLAAQASHPPGTTEANFSFLRNPPRNILLLKGHSAGIGDLLRSSAAWRVLRNALPHARFHLWFLSNDPGSPSEQLIARHHLLASFSVATKQTRHQGGWQRLWREAQAVAERTTPDLIVDFEPNGLRTSLLTWRLARQTQAVSVGIAQVPLRRFFYRRAAPSAKSYARRHGIPWPLEYCERDFVALAGLGLERNGTPIELSVTQEGREFQTRLVNQLPHGNNRPWLGLNIGCGTTGAGPKRPDFDLLTGLVEALQKRHHFALLLTGAPYESEINREFLSRFKPPGPVLDLAGRTNMLELAGAISQCRLFLSSDSGPYHMAVALRVRTLALFNFPNPQHYHQHPWVECLLAPDVRSQSAALSVAERLLQVNPPPLPA
ncbi:MAG: glycosyltransferase family 9 protein [Verrucomicrobiota bacterium]|nr:glycosyltransferase family 9 protein [Verrucomicrobiota bacterium]